MKKCKPKLKAVSNKDKIKAVYANGGIVNQLPPIAPVAAPKQTLGNQIGGGLTQLAPLLSMIPGIGQFAGTAAGILGQGLDPNQTSKFEQGGIVNKNVRTGRAIVNRYDDGGPLADSVIINAERKELIVDPKSNKTLMDLKNLPPHPEDPNQIDPAGTLNLPDSFQGKLVIPNSGVNGRKSWEDARRRNDPFATERIKRNLENKQAIMEAKDVAKNFSMFKDGGNIKAIRNPKSNVTSSWKFENGGRIKRYDQNSIIDGEIRPNNPGGFDVSGNNPYIAGTPVTTAGADGRGWYVGTANSTRTMANRLFPSTLDPRMQSSVPSTPGLTNDTWDGTKINPLDYDIQDPLSPVKINRVNNPNEKPPELEPRKPRFIPPDLNFDKPKDNRLARGLLNNAGNLYQLGNAIFNKEETNPVNNNYQRQALDQFKNRKYDINPLLRSNEQTFAGGNYALKQGGMNGSEYRANLTSQLRNKYMADSQAWSTKNNVENGYKAEYGQALNNAGEQNRNEGIRVQTANEQNRAMRQTAISSSLGSIGRNIAEQGNDDIRMSLLPQLFPNLGKTPEEVINNLTGKVKRG